MILDGRHRNVGSFFAKTIVLSRGILTKRIAYMKNELHIELNEDILPMCSTVAYLRPFLLNKEKAMQITH